jgi:hypothetical protein
MLIFGLLTIKNIRRNRRLVQPIANVQNQSNINRRDNQLLTMLLLQVMIIIIFTLPFAIQKLINTFTTTTNQTSLQKAQYNLLTGTLRLISYGSHAFGFYFYTLAARIFRTELLKIINKIYRFFTGKDLFTQTRSTILGMTLMKTDGTVTQTMDYQHERRA